MRVLMAGLAVERDKQRSCACRATLLHIHVRDPKTGHISKKLSEYGEQIARLRKAVPKMILQVGGSISFAPEPDEEAKLQSYDSRYRGLPVRYQLRRSSSRRLVLPPNGGGSGIFPVPASLFLADAFWRVSRVTVQAREELC
jgi:hypothetical protein